MAVDSLQHKATSSRQVKQTRLMRLLSTHNDLLHWGFANALIDVKNPTPHFFLTPSTLKFYYAVVRDISESSGTET